MEAFGAHHRGTRGRGGGGDLNGRGGGGRPMSRNKQWVAGEASHSATRPAGVGVGMGGGMHGVNGHGHEGERWERGGFHGRGRGRGAARGGGVPPRMFPNSTLRNTHEVKPVAERRTQTFAPASAFTTNVNANPGARTINNTMDPGPEDDNDEPLPTIHEPPTETQEEREKLYQELVAAREQERKSAIAEGRMDDPLVPKRLEDAITIVGTCPDMCPRFERYRRERENNLFEWETIPGTKRIDHSRAVKMYERAAGDKTLPSDLRPPHVLRKTLDYLFHDLLPRGTLSRTAQFIRDRSRAVRNDITMQHLTGRLAIECHDRCARFHILVMHFEREKPGFSLPLEEQQLMNTLQSLKEFYEDQRGRYESPTELEMRVYHRLIHIRDQRERHENIPEHISSHPVFKLTTDFRLHVQKKSEPITKTSALVVDAQGMEIFGRLAAYLREMGDTAMIYLVACILERLFGKDTIENIEAIRGELTVSDVIDGKSDSARPPMEEGEDEDMQENEDEQEEEEEYYDDEQQEDIEQGPEAPAWPVQNYVPPPATFGGVTTSVPVHKSAFASLTATATPNVFGNSFGAPASSSAPVSVFGTFTTKPSAPSPVPPPINTPPTFFPPSHPAPPPPVAPTQPANHVFSMPPALPQPSASTPPSNFLQPPPPANDNSSLLQPPIPAPLNPKASLFFPSSSFTLSPAPRKRSPPSNAQPSNEAAAPVAAPTLFSRERSNSSFGSNRNSSTPPPLKIDTSVSSSSSSATSAAAAVPSPRDPPTLGRVQPVSLPSTPNTIPPPSALPSYLKGNLWTPPPSSATPERSVLSPLVLQTPQTSTFQSPGLNNFSPAPPKQAFGILMDNNNNHNNGKGKTPVARQNESMLPTEVLEIMRQKASTFERSSAVVRKYFGRWLQKTIDRAAYIEACRQSDAYREKMRLQKSLLTNGNSGGGGGTTTMDRKRRISMTVSAPATESPQRKRARKRVSSTYQAPRTDEELAQRFKENQEDVERRWAQGSFLQTFKTLFKQWHASTTATTAMMVPKPLPSAWQIWLSMNPESDATAIWIERKFDVPNSGQWITESVFSIPVGEGGFAHHNNKNKNKGGGGGHPGVAVFECTPLEGVEDDIERKYRVLDDCSRLRDVIKAFPSRRYYVPSILFLCWARSPEQYPDLFSMADKLVKEGTIKGYQTMLLNAADKDPDEKFETCLKNTPVDLEGELVRVFSVRELYRHFLTLLNPFITEWVGSCSTGDMFNWKLYNFLIHVIVGILNNVESHLRRLCDVGGGDTTTSKGLVEFEDHVMDDSDSAYDSAEEWLSAVLSTSNIDVSLVLIDIQSHRNIEQDFPLRTFLDHILEIAQLQASHSINLDQPPSTQQQQQHLILVQDLVKATSEIEQSLAPLRVKLSHRLNTTGRRSPPKRRSRSVAATSGDVSPESKRMRLSSTSSLNGGDTTPFSSPVFDNSAGGGGAGGFTPQYTTPPSPSSSVMSLSLPSEVSTPGATSGMGAGGAKAKPPTQVTAAMLRALTQDLKKKYMLQS